MSAKWYQFESLGKWPRILKEDWGTREELQMQLNIVDSILKWAQQSVSNTNKYHTMFVLMILEKIKETRLKFSHVSVTVQ